MAKNNTRHRFLDKVISVLIAALVSKINLVKVRLSNNSKPFCYTELFLLFLLNIQHKFMRKYFTFLLIICFNLIWSQNILYPNYIYTKNLKNIELVKTDDTNTFHLKHIQYLGEPKKSITVSYTDYDKVNPILENNYKIPNDTLNKDFNKHIYENIKIFVDTRQSTPLIQTSIDFTQITEAELESEIDKINDGKKSTKEIPEKEIFYDGFPVTIYNLDDKNDKIIGFGNHVPLELEALSNKNIWKKVYGVKKYGCGVGITYVILKPNQIVTVFEPRLKGNFKTKFRYKLGNIFSNEFEGNINDKYLNEIK